MYRFLCLDNSLFSLEKHNIEGGRKEWGLKREGRDCAGELEAKSRDGKHPSGQKERENRQAGRSSTCLAALKKPDAGIKPISRSQAFSKQTARIPRAGRAAPCPPCVPRCSQMLPRGTARIPGPAAAWGSSSHAGKTQPGMGEPVTSQERVFPGVPGHYQLLPQPPCCDVCRENHPPLLLPPKGILAGALCSAGPPTASPFPFVLLLAALRNHSLWKHLSTMDWVEYIQSSRQ